MWCKRCHQEVPGVAGQGDERVCPRCGQPGDAGGMLSAASSPAVAEASGSSKTPIWIAYQRRLPPCEDWELDDTLRRVAFAVRSRGLAPATSRIDSAHPEPNAPHCGVARVGGVFQAVEEFQSRGLLPALSWIALFLGTMAASCGGVLLGWSRLSARPELWGIGYPIALGGICCLVVALILQLDAGVGAKSS